MSHSRKKTPVGSFLKLGWTEKEDKKIWHRRLRSRDQARLNELVRRQTRQSVEDLFENFLPSLPREMSDTLLMRKEFRVRWSRKFFSSEREYQRWIAK